MSSQNNWYVVTGGPSSGKTTVLAELEKLGYKTIPEAARRVIDEAIANGKTVAELRSDEKKFQEEVVRLKQKIEDGLEYNVVTFFDRGMHDTAAYLRFYGYSIGEWIDKLLSKSEYKKVFLLNPLPKFKKDYARTEGQDFPGKIHKLLHDAYSEFGMSPIHVPVMSPIKRAKFILKKLEGEGNQ